MATNGYEERRKKLERRRALVTAMTPNPGAQIPAGQMVGPHFLPTSLGQALAPALQLLAGNYAAGKLDKEESELNAERQFGLSQALQQMEQARQTGDNSWTHQALSSPYEEVQKLGQKAFEYGLKPETFQRDMVKNDRGELISILTGNRGTERESQYKPATKMSTAYGRVYDPYSVQPGQQIATPPSQSTNITINNAADKKLYEAAGKGVGERIASQLLDKRRQLVRDFETATQLQQVASEGMATGQLAPMGVFLGQMASSLGVEPAEILTNAEQYDSTIERSVTQHILAGGRGITDEDARRLAKSWAPLTNSPQGRAKILEDIKALKFQEFQEVEGALENIRQKDQGLYDILSLDPGMQGTIDYQPGIEGNVPTTNVLDAIPGNTPKKPRVLPPGTKITGDW